MRGLKGQKFGGKYGASGRWGWGGFMWVVWWEGVNSELCVWGGGGGDYPTKQQATVEHIQTTGVGGGMMACSGFWVGDVGGRGEGASTCL